jgi:hypothetical protein
MTISLRSVKLIMHKVAPNEKKISEDAVRLLKIFLERKPEELTLHASRIHNRENRMRDELGERHKVILSLEHVKMAIDGKFTNPQGEKDANSQH